MSESRVKNSVMNIGTGILSRLISLLINFISRTVFIKILGESCLGLNGLFTSLLSMLSLAELGIGQALTFYMYKPIAKKDENRLASLIAFYKISYRIIGSVILIIGLCLIPFLHQLVKLESDTGYNVYFVYVLYLVNTSISYLFFSYPQTVLSANQKQSIINKYNAYFVIISACSEILVLLITKDYYFYLIVRISIGVLKNIMLAIKAIALFPYIKAKPSEKIGLDELKTMFKDVYSIFVVKLSSQLFNSTDNLFISAMFGTVLVGYNDNYILIINAIYGVISTIVYSLTGSIGNLYASESKYRTERVFATVDFCNQFISLVCTVCLFQLLNPFISLVWGKNMIFSLLAVAMMCASFYIVSSLYGLFAFRQSMGLFRYCVYNQLFAAIINIVLDYILGRTIGIEGFFIATTVANIGFAVFPYAINIYKIGFELPYMPYVMKIIKGYLICIVSCALTWYCCRNINNSFIGLFQMGIISVVVPSVIFCILNMRSDEMKMTINYVKRILHSSL